METLYDFMLDHLQHDFRCPDCQSRMWVGYSDGHVWYKCFDCDEPSNRFSLGPAGYITNYPVPAVPLPENLEVSEKHYSTALEHERFYRIKHGETIDKS